MTAGAVEAEATKGSAWLLVIAYAVAVAIIPAALVFAPFGAFGTPAALIGTIAFAVWIFGRLHPASTMAFGPQPMRIVVLGFLGAVVASYAVAHLRVLPGFEARGADRGLLNVIALSGIALLAMDGIRTRRQLDRILTVVVGVVSIGAAIGLLQFFFSFDVTKVFTQIPGLATNRALDPLKSRVSIPRVAGTAMHPIEFGVVCAMAMPIAMHFARRSPRRIVLWIPIALLGFAILTSVSRSGILALIVGMAVYIATWPPRQRAIALASVPVLLVPARFLVPGLLGTLSNLFLRFGSDSSVTARTEDYATTSATIIAHFWFGRGFGTYIPPVAPILDNQFLGQFVETGIVGLIAVILLGVVGIGTARGARRRSTDPVVRDQAQALAAAIAGGFLAFATYDFLAFAFSAGLFFLLLGCVGAAWRMSGGVLAWSPRPAVATA